MWEGVLGFKVLFFSQDGKTDLERGVLSLDHYKKYKSTIDSNL